MPRHKLIDTQIAICIVPKRVRWPQRNTSVAWTKAHASVDAFQDLVRSVDIACVEAEEDSELSANGIARRRAEICDQALRKLASFRSFEIAEKALTENIDALERLSAWMLNSRRCTKL
jgi:hypothetical protein